MTFGSGRPNRASHARANEALLMEALPFEPCLDHADPVDRE
jgi:hypothetical protein